MCKMCPYFNFTKDSKLPLIYCKARRNDKVVRFIHKEGRDKWHFDFCSNNYRGCMEFKILRAKEARYNE